MVSRQPRSALLDRYGRVADHWVEGIDTGLQRTRRIIIAQGRGSQRCNFLGQEVILPCSSSCSRSAFCTRLINSVRSNSSAGAARVVCSAATANRAPMIVASAARAQRPRAGSFPAGDERVVRVDRLPNDLIQQVHAGVRCVAGRLSRRLGGRVFDMPMTGFASCEVSVIRLWGWVLSLLAGHARATVAVDRWRGPEQPDGLKGIKASGVPVESCAPDGECPPHHPSQLTPALLA